MYYTVNQKAVTIVGCDKKRTELVVPEKIDGLQVSYIGESAFANSMAESISLPKSISSLAYKMCQNATALKSISFGYQVNTIPESCFDGCTALTDFPTTYINYIYTNAFHNCTSLNIQKWPSLSSVSSSAFSGCTALTAFTMPGECSYVPSNLFDGCTALESVKISNYCTSIDSYAFHNCSALASIQIPAMVSSISSHAFDGCSKLESIELPDAVTYLSDHVFANCTSLKSFVIPKDISYLNDGTFENCTSLESITFNDKIDTIYNYMFRNCTALKEITLPSKITNVYTEAFRGCTALERVTFETMDNLYFSTYSFLDCPNLTEINSQATYFSYGTNCVGFQSVTTDGETTLIPSEKPVTFSMMPCTNQQYYLESYPGANVIWKTQGITYHLNEAGDGVIIDKISSQSDKSLSIYLPDQIDGLPIVQIGNGTPCLDTPNASYVYCSVNAPIETIADYAFFGCKNLSSFSTNSEVLENVGLELFYGTEYQNNKKENAQDLIIASNILYRCFTNSESYTVSDTITRIGSDAFRANKTLKEIILPESIVRIDDGAFFDCTALESMVLPEATVTLGNTAFGGCSSLTDVTMGANLSEIGQNIFYQCDALTNVTAPEKSAASAWIAENFTAK